MDLSRLKKVAAGISVAAIALGQAATVFAAYSDVPSGVWYEDAVSAFTDAGYLDATQSRFRGGDLANRAEFVKLVVELNGGILSTPPAVASFNDVPTGAWFYGYFEEAGKEGWVKGDGNCYGSKPCYARPSANINRAEAAALIVRAFGLESSGDAPQFVDNPSGQWYTEVIQTAADACVLQGDSGTSRVRPSDPMNRAEMVTMLHRVDQGLQYGVDCGGGDVVSEPMIKDVVATSDTTVEVEFNTSIDSDAGVDVSKYTVTGGGDIAVSSASMIGDDTVELTLGESTDAGAEYTVAVEDMVTAGGESFSDSATFNGYTDLVLGNGTLEVSLASSNPAGDTLPKGAVGVVMESIDLTASCEDSVSIETLTVLHEGFGDETDISGVYASIDGARVSRKRTIDSEDQTSDLRFSSPLVIDPCETVTVDLVADFTTAADTSAEHNLVVELPSDVVSNAKDVTGDFPLRGNTFRLAAVTSGTVTIDYRSITPSQVEVGDKAVVVGKFEVAVDSTEDQTLYSMTLEQNGTVSDGDVANLAIRRTDGTVLTNTVAQTVGDFVTLVFDPPFTVLEGDKITLEVIADIVGGADSTVQFGFEESGDLFAVGSLYGYGVNGQLYGSQVSLDSSAPGTISIDAGQFTIAVNGPAQQDYTRDDNDAVLANIEFDTGGEDIDVKNIFMAIEAESSSGGSLCELGGAAAYSGCSAADEVSDILENVQIRNKKTGRTIDGVRLTGSTDSGQGTATNAGTFQIYRFDDFVVKGSETWEFQVDFTDNGAGEHPRDGDKFRVHVCTEPTDITVDGSLTTNSTSAGYCTFADLLASTTATLVYQMEVEGLSTGDAVGDVRPGGNIAGNFMRIANATLTVAVKATGVSDTAVRNAKNVNFLRFEARAGQAEDILLTSAVFEAASGSLIDGQNWSLWVDTDGDSTVDQILEKGRSSQSSKVTFSDMTGGGFVIPAEETVIFEVHADIASSLAGTDLQLRFATGAVGDSIRNSYIEAEQLDDGSSLSGIKTNSTFPTGVTSADILVTTTATQNWVLIGQGDLYVTKDSTQLPSRQYLGGTLGEAGLRLQMHAENEPIDVTDLQITASGSTALSIDRLELYKEGQTTAFALATIGGCGTDDTMTKSSTFNGTNTATFCANMENRQLVVPEGADIDVIVRPRMKTDVQGAVSAEKIVFLIDRTPNSDNNTGSGAVRARGDYSSNDLTANNGTGGATGEVFIGTTSASATNSYIVGQDNNSVLSKISSITNANTDANGSAIPNGKSNIGAFKFAAAAHTNSKNGLNDAVLSGVVFNLTATNVDLDETSFKIYNKNNSSDSAKAPCYVFTSTGATFSGVATVTNSAQVDCSSLIGSVVNTEIDQGSDITLVLEAVINDNNTTSNGVSTLQVILQDFNSISKTSYGIGSTKSHIWWQDKDSGDTDNFYWVEYSDTTVKSTSYSA